MWNKSIKIPTGKTITTDADGFETEAATYMEHIPASFKDAARSDALLAKQSGYNVDVIIEIMACVYNGASYVVDESDGTIYDVQRAYQKDKAMTVQLTATRREHGKL